jgi:hypothetical protein
VSTSIGTVIEQGQAIPDDVDGFRANDGDFAARTDGLDYGAWAARGCGPRCVGHAYDDFAYPLTVTAVREPDPICDAATCQKPESRAAYWERRFNEEAARGDTAAQQILTLHRERDSIQAEFDELASFVTVRLVDPLVLSLPQVPEGAVRLIASNGVRWLPGSDGVWTREDMPDLEFRLGELLDSVESVTVEMAPPREPRTWPKLDDAPDGVSKVRVRRTDGTQFVCARRRDGFWASASAFADPENAELNETFTWGELLGEGDVTEVFDDEAGTR